MECQTAPSPGSCLDRSVLLSRRSLAATKRSGSRFPRCGISDLLSAEDTPAFGSVFLVGSAANPRKAARKSPSVSQGHQSRCGRRCLLDDVRVIGGNGAIRFNSGAFAPSFRGPDAAFYWRRWIGSMFQRLSRAELKPREFHPRSYLNRHCSLLDMDDRRKSS